MNEDGCLLGRNAVLSGRSLPTFLRPLLPPSSGPTRRYDPEDSHLRTHRRENLKSYVLVCGVYSAEVHPTVVCSVQGYALLRLCSLMLCACLGRS
jgi:hypothetical protein